MRAAVAISLLALAGCATSSVALLPAEPGSNVGAVALFNPKDGAELGQLTTANTQTPLGGPVKPRPLKPDTYASLTAAMPAPVARFTLYFVEGSTKLAPGSEPELQKMLAEVARRSGVEVQITGHTDTVGSDADNDALSIKRAREVRDALLDRGLKLTETRIAGRGERELLIQTPDNVDEPRNRRVEITVR